MAFTKSRDRNRGQQYYELELGGSARIKSMRWGGLRGLRDCAEKIFFQNFRGSKTVMMVRTD